MSKEKNKIQLTPEQILDTLKEVKNNLDGLFDIELFNRIKDTVKELNNISEKIEMLNSEIDELRLAAEDAKRKKNHSLYNVLRRNIANRIDLVKKLYESRADIEAILQKYYEMIANYQIKYIDQMIKTYKELSKEKDDSSIKDILNEFILKISAQGSTIQHQAQKNSDDSLIMDNQGYDKNDELIEDIDLPDEMKSI